MKPSRAEKIVDILWLAASVLFGVSGICLVSFSGPGSASLNAICLCVVAITYLPIVGGGIIGWILSHKRIAIERSEQRRLALEAVELPDLAQLDTSHAILALIWTIDYKTHARLVVVYNLSRVLSWMNFGLTGIMCTWAVYILYGVHGYGTLAGIFVAFSLTVGLLQQLALAQSVRRLFPFAAPRQNMALVLDKEGLHQIFGHSVVDLAWPDLKKFREFRGFVLYFKSGLMMFNSGLSTPIPNGAFRSRADAKAFVAAANALKKGQPLPAYDWSAYKPEVPVTVLEGVWPPSIKT